MEYLVYQCSPCNEWWSNFSRSTEALRGYLNKPPEPQSLHRCELWFYATVVPGDLSLEEMIAFLRRAQWQKWDLSWHNDARCRESICEETVFCKMSSLCVAHVKHFKTHWLLNDLKMPMVLTPVSQNSKYVKFELIDNSIRERSFLVRKIFASFVCHLSQVIIFWFCTRLACIYFFFHDILSDGASSVMQACCEMFPDILLNALQPLIIPLSVCRCFCFIKGDTCRKSSKSKKWQHKVLMYTQTEWRRLICIGNPNNRINAH